MRIRLVRRATGAALALLACLALAGLVSGPAAKGAPATGDRLERGDRDWKPNIAAAKRFARSRKGQTRFTAVDMRGRARSFRGGATVEAASVMKVLYLVAYLRMHRDEAVSDSDKRILGPMIRESNNRAAREIQARIGGSRVDRLARKADMTHFRRSEPYWGLSRIATVDWARFMFRLERYTPRRHTDYAKRLLASIVARQRWGVGAVAPRGWRLMFKGGWGVGDGKVQNQVALLERGKRRVALAVFTDGGALTAGYKRTTIAGVSERLLRGLPR
ncbi:hypothetical protein HJD18_11465 [Thermoleophilia bacterium SCSIO 60948]|nr:hypothetical protein HJD18_11465 [Thermoleophilia bacterium SCSIO 60948]